MQVIEAEQLDELSRRAQASPRLRMNHNFHASPDDPCQRLLNAIEPGSYVRPHRHRLQPKAELFVAVRGRMALLHFDQRGTLLAVVPLVAGGATAVAEVATGEWHTIVALERGSVFLEVKAGPYRPIDAEDFAEWAPAEGTAAATELLARWQGLGRGAAGSEVA